MFSKWPCLSSIDAPRFDSFVTWPVHVLLRCLSVKNLNIVIIDCNTKISDLVAFISFPAGMTTHWNSTRTSWEGRGGDRRSLLPLSNHLDAVVAIDHSI